MGQTRLSSLGLLLLLSWCRLRGCCCCWLILGVVVSLSLVISLSLIVSLGFVHCSVFGSLGLSFSSELLSLQTVTLIPAFLHLGSEGVKLLLEVR